jgi:hypothetical protein
LALVCNAEFEGKRNDEVKFLAMLTSLCTMTVFLLHRVAASFHAGAKGPVVIGAIVCIVVSLLIGPLLLRILVPSSGTADQRA